jgi:transposase
MINIGIDIAKRAHVAAAVDAAGKAVIGSFQFNNTADGFAKLLARLAGAGAEPGDSLIGMEATGHYWIALFDFLCSHGWKVAVINPIQTDAFRRVETVRKLKTDASDALLIADLVRYKAFEPSAMADEAAAGIRDLARFRMSLVQECAALKNQMKALMDRAFPEYGDVFPDMFCASSMAVLKAFPAPERVAGTDIRTIERTIREASRGRLGRAKAEQLKAAAKASVGVSFGAGQLAFQARIIAETIEFVEARVAEIEDELDSMLAGTQGEWLKTVPGIDTVLASLIAGEIGDANRFATPKQLIAYAGMDASKRQSGGSDPDGHMSKRGTPFLRYGLMQAAEGARRHDAYFREYYENAIARGKHHYVALSGVARKLAGVVLSLMKEGRPYEPVPPSHHRPGHLKG